jgi:hypothetical protein
VLCAEKERSGRLSSARAIFVKGWHQKFNPRKEGPYISFDDRCQDILIDLLSACWTSEN